MIGHLQKSLLASMKLLWIANPTANPNTKQQGIFHVTDAVRVFGVVPLANANNLVVVTYFLQIRVFPRFFYDVSAIF